MKHTFLPSEQFARFTLLVFIICVFCHKADTQDFRNVHLGVEHAQVEYKLGSDPVKINLLRLDLAKVRLDVHHAHDRAIGLETTSSIATRHGAIAALNAGFFRLDKSLFAGDAAGVLVIDGEVWSETTSGRVAMEIDNRRSSTLINLHHMNAIAWFGILKTPEYASLTGINRERKRDDAILYTPRFGETTLTEKGGIEFVLSGCETKQRKNGRPSICSRIVRHDGAGNTVIPRDGFVLSLGPDARTDQSPLSGITGFWRTGLRKGEKLVVWTEFHFQGASRTPNGSSDVVAGVPQLIRDGRIDITWEQEKASKSFVETRHPRTAVAKLKDGKFLMITVDGRQPGVSVGMSLHELADYLLSLGATDAMNLDGGGSTTMFLDGKVVNTPSDKEGERKVSDAIVVTLRAKSK